MNSISLVFYESTFPGKLNTMPCNMALELTAYGAISIGLCFLDSRVKAV